MASHSLQSQQERKSKKTPLHQKIFNIKKGIINKYHTINDDFNRKQISDIIFNEKSRVVAHFKDYLLYDDQSEFLKRFYKRTEQKTRLNKIFSYYSEFSKIFPNYIVLSESKYIYKNIQRKQRMIDNQQIQESKNKKSLVNSVNYDSDKILNTEVVESINNISSSFLVLNEDIIEKSHFRNIDGINNKYNRTESLERLIDVLNGKKIDIKPVQSSLISKLNKNKTIKTINNIFKNSIQSNTSSSSLFKKFSVEMDTLSKDSPLINSSSRGSMLKNNTSALSILKSLDSYPNKRNIDEAKDKETSKKDIMTLTGIKIPPINLNSGSYFSGANVSSYKTDRSERKSSMFDMNNIKFIKNIEEQEGNQRKATYKVKNSKENLKEKEGNTSNKNIIYVINQNQNSNINIININNVTYKQNKNKNETSTTKKKNEDNQRKKNSIILDNINISNNIFNKKGSSHLKSLSESPYINNLNNVIWNVNENMNENLSGRQYLNSNRDNKEQSSNIIDSNSHKKSNSIISSQQNKKLVLVKNDFIRKQNNYIEGTVQNKDNPLKRGSVQNEFKLKPTNSTSKSKEKKENNIEVSQFKISSDRKVVISSKEERQKYNSIFKNKV